MQLYSEGKNYKLYEGNMLDLLEVIDPDSIDSVITDPPYELNFMGKGWDNSGIAFQPSTWEKCYKVLKPGGYLLAFGGSRTFHRIAVAIEDAGFEIRDTICWLYGSGFPKSYNIGLAIDKKNGVQSEVVGNSRSGVSSRAFQSEELTTAGEYEIRKAQNEWDGWGTALKPAYEPVIIARKPCEGSCIDNVQKYGVGGINIDECRIPTDDYLYNHGNSKGTVDSYSVGNFGKAIKGENRSTELGRFPSNVILTYDEEDEQEVCGGMPYCHGAGNVKEANISETYNNSSYIAGNYKHNPNYYNDEGSASRYFYCAKASGKDRDEGLEAFEKFQGGTYQFRQDGSLDGGVPERKNIHPTVKPCELMQYLIRLVTPKGGVILDPFNGSGSTGKATMYENKEKYSEYRYIGIELTPEYLPIAEARINYVTKLTRPIKLF